MIRFPLLLIGLLGALSCAGPSTTPSLLAGPAEAAQTIRETFDTRSLGEDLLLIQPVFQRANLNHPVSDLVGEITTEPAVLAEVDIAPDLPVESGSVDVFRLQLVTLSNEAIARKRQTELQQALATTVHLINRGEHFLLQAGQYETYQEAEKLKEHVANLGADYADAYVISATIEATLEGPVHTEIMTPSPIEPEAAIELVRTFGWRVLIDQFLSHDKANQLKQRAIKRLRRQDIDVTFKAPWYKVEVGHYRTDSEAQAATEPIEAHYPNALKVRSQILVPRED